MTTITIEVAKKSQAKMLVEILGAIDFVQNISLVKDSTNIGNATILNDLLADIKPKQLFNNIDNPVEFQNKLRNEW